MSAEKYLSRRRRKRTRRVDHLMTLLVFHWLVYYERFIIKFDEGEAKQLCVPFPKTMMTLLLIIIIMIITLLTFKALFIDATFILTSLQVLMTQIADCH